MRIVGRGPSCCKSPAWKLCQWSMVSSAAWSTCHVVAGADHSSRAPARARVHQGFQLHAVIEASVSSCCSLCSSLQQFMHLPLLPAQVLLTPAWQVFRCWSSGVLHTYVHRSGVAWYLRVVGCDVCKQLLLYADRLCSPSMPAQHSTKMMQLSQIWLGHRQSSTHSYIAHTAIGWHRLVSSSVSYKVTAHTGQKTRAVRRP